MPPEVAKLSTLDASLLQLAATSCCSCCNQQLQLARAVSPEDAFEFTESFSLNFVFCRTQDVFLFDEIEAEGSELKLSVFDHNGLSKDELIGEVVLR